MLLSLIRMIQAFRDYQRNVSELSQPVSYTHLTLPTKRTV